MAVSTIAQAGLSASRSRVEQRIQDQFERALSNEEATGRRLSTGALLIGLGVISIWLLVQLGLERVWFYEMVLGLFGLLVIANYLLAQGRYDRPWRTYAFQTCFLALLVTVIVVPRPGRLSTS